MKRFFQKIEDRPFAEAIRKRIEKEHERRVRFIEGLRRLKTPAQRRDYLRYKALGSWNKDEIDYKYGE